MNSHSKRILDQLIQKYEKSNKSNAFKVDSNKRIMYSMKNDKQYDVRDLDQVNECNEAMEELAKKHYVIIEYDKEHTNHMKRIILNTALIDEIYEEYYHKKEKSQEALQLEAMFQEAKASIATEWISLFLKEELAYLREKGWVHAYLKKDIKKIQDLLAVLAYIDQGSLGYIRAMSIALFQDSKYFEEESNGSKLKNMLLSVVHGYEPTYLQAKADEYKMTDSEVFRSLGFHLFPEVFSWYGAMNIILNNGDVLHTASYMEEFMLSGDMVSHIDHIEARHTTRLILIENKANYYHNLTQKDEGDIVMFAGGHFSPVKKKLYQKIAEGITCPVYLSSDIDLGGFYMFSRLKNEVFPQLQPLHMDVKTMETYIAYGKTASDDYLLKVKKAKEREDLSEFYEVMDLILKLGKTLEQEAMI